MNTAAASNLGPWLTIKATSFLPEDLSPAETPLAKNPFAAVTLISDQPNLKFDPSHTLDSYFELLVHSRLLLNYQAR